MTQDVDVDDFLAHFGVRGMRWGVRGARSKVSRTLKELDNTHESFYNGSRINQSPEAVALRLNKVANKLKDSTVDKASTMTRMELGLSRALLGKEGFNKHYAEMQSDKAKVEEWLDYYRNIDAKEIAPWSDSGKGGD